MQSGLGHPITLVGVLLVLADKDEERGAEMRHDEPREEDLEHAQTRPLERRVDQRRSEDAVDAQQVLELEQGVPERDGESRVAARLRQRVGEELERRQRDQVQRESLGAQEPGRHVPAVEDERAAVLDERRAHAHQQVERQQRHQHAVQRHQPVARHGVERSEPRRRQHAPQHHQQCAALPPPRKAPARVQHQATAGEQERVLQCVAHAQPHAVAPRQLTAADATGHEHAQQWHNSTHEAV